MKRTPRDSPLHTALALLFALSLGACAEDAESTHTEQTQEATAREAGGHWAAARAAGVVQGSHADWCGEHGVPESLCTRCNPSLIPAFRATGDWCEEHELPQSQCRICNPDLVIERPPAE